jgi:hypothetical protein
MAPAPAPAPADRFARIIDGLCRAVAARVGKPLAGPVIVLIWTRLRRTVARFTVLAARVRAGVLPSPSRPRPRAASRPASPPPAQRLPTTFGWLVRQVPEAAGYRSQLCHLLSDPEMVALLSAAPQAGRLLRPLCRMLAIKPGPNLLPPRSTNPASRARPDEPPTHKSDPEATGELRPVVPTPVAPANTTLAESHHPPPGISVPTSHRLAPA